MAASDRELVEICNHGDGAEAERAFGELYTRYKDFVLRVALRYVRDNELALDALQETFTYLLKKFPPAGEGLELTARLSTFLYPVAKNSAISQLRKAGKFAAEQGIDPDDLPARVPVERGLDPGLLAGLPDERREVLLLRFVDELSLQEIAEALDIPLGTVKSRLHLAIRQLRDNPDIEKIHFS